MKTVGINRRSRTRVNDRILVVDYCRRIASEKRHARPARGFTREDARVIHQSSLTALDLDRLLAWMKTNNLTAVTDYLVGELERLARAGSISSSRFHTPHIVFDNCKRVRPSRCSASSKQRAMKRWARGLKKVGRLALVLPCRDNSTRTFSCAQASDIVPNERRRANLYPRKISGECSRHLQLGNARGLLAIVTG